MSKQRRCQSSHNPILLKLIRGSIKMLSVVSLEINLIKEITLTLWKQKPKKIKTKWILNFVFILLKKVYYNHSVFQMINKHV